MAKPVFNVVVFSGNAAPNERHRKMAERIGQELANHRMGVVNGGGSGLMECVAKSAHAEGGHVTGVHFDFEGREVSPHNTETIKFSVLKDRQKKVLELGDAYLALPGGLGTLYEIVEVISLKYVGDIPDGKPLILMDKQYWKKLDQLIDDLIGSRYANKRIKNLYCIVDTIDEVMPILQAYAAAKND